MHFSYQGKNAVQKICAFYGEDTVTDIKCQKVWKVYC